MKQSIIVVILAMLVTLLIIHFAVQETYKLRAFEVSVNVDLASYPRTTINFPPAGKITADTHWAPINLELTLEAIHQQKLARIISELDNKEALYSLLEERTNQILKLFIIRLFLLGSFGGLIGAAIVQLDRKTVLLGLLTAWILIAALVSITYYSYDLTTFEDPHFSGMLEAAPWMVGVIQEGLTNIEQLGAEMEQIASNMAQLFNKLDSFQPLGKVTSDLQVLHVSDIHNNPAALQFISQIIASFQVDLVIDTGDITEYGTALEGELLTEIENLAVPYIFVAGNHDSPTVIEKLDSFDNVIILDRELVSIQGLIVAGAADPAVASKQIAPLNPEQMQESSQALDKLITSNPQQVDILAVHQAELGRSLLGKVPVLLHGHTHKFEISREQETLVINAGTTGAAGIRGFKNKSELPNSVALLHYKQLGDDLQLEIVDIIKFYSQRSGFSLQRKLVNLQGGDNSE